MVRRIGCKYVLSRCGMDLWNPVFSPDKVPDGTLVKVCAGPGVGRLPAGSKFAYVSNLGGEFLGMVNSASLVPQKDWAKTLKESSGE